MGHRGPANVRNLGCAMPRRQSRQAGRLADPWETSPLVQGQLQLGAWGQGESREASFLPAVGDVQSSPAPEPGPRRRRSVRDGEASPHPPSGHTVVSGEPELRKRHGLPAFYQRQFSGSDPVGFGPCIHWLVWLMPFICFLPPIKIGLKYARWRKKVWSDNGIQSVRIIFSVSDLREPELLITLNVLFYLIPKWLFYEGFTFFFYLLYCKWGHRISERFFPKITFPRGVKRRQFIRSRMPPVGADWAATLF